MKEKRCSQCGQVKSQKEFAVDKRFKNKKRYRSICAVCDADHGGADEPPKVVVGVPWKHDLEILTRLDVVGAMLIEGAKPYQVAQVMGYSWDTAKRDIDRVRELWADDTAANLRAQREQAVAEYRHDIMRAYEQYRLAGDPKIKLGFLRAVNEARRQVDNILGLHAPKEINVHFPLPDEAVRALETLEQAGISRDSIQNEFVQFLIEAAAEAEKVKVLDRIGAGGQ